MMRKPLILFLLLASCGTESFNTQPESEHSAPFDIQDPLPSDETAQKAKSFDWSDNKPVIFHHKNEALNRTDSDNLFRRAKTKLGIYWNLDNTDVINQDLLAQRNYLLRSDTLFIGMELPGVFDMK